MRVALDTNRLSDLLRGEVELVRFLERCESICIPFAVLAEVRVGFLNGSRLNENEARLANFLNAPNVAILYASRYTVDHYSNLVVQLKRAGKPIPINDVWIAAICLEHTLTLLTRDRHFDNLPQLLTRNT